MKDKETRLQYRRERTRGKIRLKAGDRPRLTVYRSLKHLYAQVVDDNSGKTLACASSSCKEFKAGKDLSAAKKVGELVAKKALAAGVKKVVFDRGAYIYHGRIKTLAEAARAGGLEF
ncbi:MAG: 50S ribosomal protein L18 [Elusimicrobia bacterium]|nr:50S ribosomal protein L18 [Elusimicrobiota bacterium]